MDTMSTVAYCLAGFGGIVVLGAAIFIIYLLCEDKSKTEKATAKQD